MSEEPNTEVEQVTAHAAKYADQTWAERNDGWEHTDELGRWVGLRYSRFHGLMISTHRDTVYIDAAEPGLREWLSRVANPDLVPCPGHPPRDLGDPWDSSPAAEQVRRQRAEQEPPT